MQVRNPAVTAAAVALATFACTREPEPVEHEVSSCVSCHESQELLMATAIPEPVEPESEAEGES